MNDRATRTLAWRETMHLWLDRLMNQIPASRPYPEPPSLLPDAGARAEMARELTFPGIDGAQVTMQVEPEAGANYTDTVAAAPEPIPYREIHIGPIGSRGDRLRVRFSSGRIEVHTGCFAWQPLEAFEEANERTHPQDVFGAEYRAAVRFIRRMAELRGMPA